MPKIKLDIVVRHTPEGKCIPIKILWEDGRKFHIDKVLDIRKAAALKCGGIGTRYICKICNREVAIFDEEGSWFIEKQDFYSPIDFLIVKHAIEKHQTLYISTFVAAHQIFCFIKQSWL